MIPNGLWYSDNGGVTNTQILMFRPDIFSQTFQITEAGENLFAATDAGVFYLYNRLAFPSGLSGLYSNITDFAGKNSKEPWFWILSTGLGIAGMYVIGIGAVLVLSWTPAGALMGHSWLITIVAKSLQAVPRAWSWALFIGYKRKVLAAEEVKAVSTYFGLTARRTDGTETRPDTSGDLLHLQIAEDLSRSPALLVTGEAGAGKSTVLARLAMLACHGGLPVPLKHLRPILVPSAAYATGLLAAISDTLRDRYGIAADAKAEIVTSQLEGGGFLILFDGVSEIDGDASRSLAEILRIAHEPRFGDCRFVISSRPLDRVPENVPQLELLPLTLEVIKDVYLPALKLDADQRSGVIEQLERFGDRVFDPLLCMMAVETGASEPTRSALFAKYFPRLRKVPAGDDLEK